MKHISMISLVKPLHLLFLIFSITLVSCTSDKQEAGSTATAPAVEQTTTTPEKEISPTSPLAPQHLEEETMLALNTIKAAFDEGISQGFGDRSPAYIYEQHAIRMRMDYFDDDPYTSVFPYNGDFDLSNLTETVNKLPFMTNKCGFQNPATKEIINYYCFNTNPTFMQYLAAVGETSGMIKRFQERYQQTKTIDADMRQAMLTQSIEEVDFSNPDHQYFYMLFHIVANEERLALEKLQNQLE